uniref:Major facilitator superfamily (MFS) profile domain-containing protein n=1 Tax=Ascaris lumbricoides TaxID=6252 RepID=A0A9J2P2Y3_ASCLU
MTRTLCCCCFSNNIRHLILILSVLSTSLLFSNILLFNAAVLHNSKDFQLFPSSEETLLPSKSLERIRREAVTETNQTETRERGNIERLESSTLFANVLDVNETVTQEIVREVLEDGNEGRYIESTHTTTAETTVLAANYSERSTSQQREADLSASSPLKSTRVASNGGIFVETASSMSAHTNNDGDHRNENLPYIPSEIPPENEENKLVSGVVIVSLEKKISLVLLWVSPGIGTFLGAVPSIWMLRAMGERRLFAATLFISSAATFWLAFMLSNEWNQFAIAGLRFVQGIAFASTFPVIGSLSANWGTLKEQFFFIAWSILFVESAPMLTWPMCALCLKYDSKLPYLLLAVITMLFALIWVIFYRDRPQYHPWVNGLELNKIVTGKVRAINNRTLEDQPFHLLLKSPAVWATWSAAFGYFLIVTLVAQFLPIYFYTLLGEEETRSILLADIPFGFVFIFALLHSLWNIMTHGCGDWLSVVLTNTLSFSICALALILFAIFPPNALGNSRIVVAFTVLLICDAVSVYGFGYSAVLVGRYFTQHIVANMQLFMGLAMIVTSTTVLLTVRSNSPNEWRLVFLASAALLLICAAIFGFLGDGKAEEWAKESWDPSAARRMISADLIDYHHDECGIVEMRLLNQ